MTLLTIADNNGVSHNHNDIESFIVHRGDRVFLVDPGPPRYTRETFSPQRYESVFCNSIGHSVPVINGMLQLPGSQYYGTLKIENLYGEGQKQATIDMSHAYPEGTVKQLIRTFTLDARANRLTLVDNYTFNQTPRALEEAFITFDDVSISRNGQSVQIGSRGNTVRLSAVDTPGRFSVRKLLEESKEGPTEEVIARITFVPEILEREMSLQFEIA